jgi:hypothetical protein
MATITNISQPRDGESADLIDLMDTLGTAICMTELIHFAAQGVGGPGQAGITAGCDMLGDIIEKAQQQVEALRSAGEAK